MECPWEREPSLAKIGTLLSSNRNVDPHPGGNSKVDASFSFASFTKRRPRHRSKASLNSLLCCHPRRESFASFSFSFGSLLPFPSVTWTDGFTIKWRPPPTCLRKRTADSYTRQSCPAKFLFV